MSDTTLSQGGGDRRTGSTPGLGTPPAWMRADGVWNYDERANVAPKDRRVATYRKLVDAILDDHRICVPAHESLHESWKLPARLHGVSSLGEDPPIILPGGKKGFLRVVEQVDVPRESWRCGCLVQGRAAGEIALLERDPVLRKER